MIKAIVYSSCTGSCEKYAHMMSEASGLPVYSLKEFARQKNKRPIVYVGWLFGGMIMGLGKARRLGKVEAVCQVGMGPETPALEGIARKKNFLPLKSVPVFYFQGAFNINGLPLPLKLIMQKKTQEIAAGLERKGSLSAQEQATLKMAKTGAGDPAAWDISKFTAWFSACK
jgi:pimeloyl-ACP methyl ester carboxylesterase